MQAHSTGIQLEDLSSQPQPQPPSNGPTTPPPLYYSTLPPSLSGKFQDLDADSTYIKCRDAILNRETKNFIVDFGGAPEERGASWCALDVDHSRETVEAVKELLKKPVFISLLSRYLCGKMLMLGVLWGI